MQNPLDSLAVTVAIGVALTLVLYIAVRLLLAA